MSNKHAVMRECDRANLVRRVYRGRVEHSTFFKNVKGNLLLSGSLAVDGELLADMIRSFADRGDMSTIVLTSHRELLERLSQEQEIMITDGDHRNYHPMYGMNPQQICHLVKLAAEELGCSAWMEQVLLYTMAALAVISCSGLVSLPAMWQLLRNSDDAIARMAMAGGLSDSIVGDILGNTQAGVLLRRIAERLMETFGEVAQPGVESKYNFQSGVQGGVPVMAFYQPSRNQKLMNTYLKEELYGTLKRVSGVRVVVDEIVFDSGEDVLLTFLMERKRQRQIELVVCSENAVEMLHHIPLDFGNVCLFHHAAATATEELSRAVFGTYPCHYPVLAAGKPPAILFTLKRTAHWTSTSEERLRVRVEDLYDSGFFGKGETELMAVKTEHSGDICLVPVDWF